MANEVIAYRKRVKPIGNSGHVVVPKEYIGKQVDVIIHPDVDRFAMEISYFKKFGKDAHLFFTHFEIERREFEVEIKLNGAYTNRKEDLEILDKLERAKEFWVRIYNHQAKTIYEGRCSCRKMDYNPIGFILELTGTMW